MNKIHHAYECLANEKKFEDYLKYLNRLLAEGQINIDEILVKESSNDSNSERPKLKLVDDMPVITPVVEDSNIIAGPSPGTPIPVEPVSGATANDGSPFNIKEEEERLANLKQKQIEKVEQQEKSKVNRLESLKKKTLKAIDEAAVKEAKRVADKIKSKGKPDVDTFFDQVYEPTSAKVEKVKEEQIAKMKRMDLPVDRESIELFESAAIKSIDSATKDEFFQIKEDGPLKGRVNSPIYLAVTIIAGVAVFLFFINFATMMWDNLPDPTGDQYSSKDSKNSPKNFPTKADTKLTVSKDLDIAKGAGLAPIAGVAGMAGFATTLKIPGSSDYNAALHSTYKRDFQNAFTQFRKSLSKNKNLYQTQYNLGCLYISKNDIKSAARSFTQSIVLRPDLAQAHYNRGVIFLREALILTRKLDEKNISQEEIDKKLNRATELVQASAREFNSTIEKAPAMPQAFYNRAIARYAFGDFAGAKEDFIEALRLNSRMEAAKFNMVLVANKLSDKEVSNKNSMPKGPEGPQGPPGPGYL